MAHRRSANYRVLLLQSPPLRKTPAGLVRDLDAPRIWVAVCLDRFVVVQGKSLVDAAHRLKTALVTEMRSTRPALSAPARYQRMWTSALPLGDPPSRPGYLARPRGSEVRLSAAS